MGRIFLHVEIASILNENGNRWMTSVEIAQLVNERGLYEKTARAKTRDVQEFQIRLRVRNYPHIFEKDGDLIRLVRQ